MCGFSGWFDPNPQAREVLERMTTALMHRGPDDAGFYLEGPVGLGHRRLAIIDLSASRQPMIEGRCALAYNGELYNFRELRGELESLGHRFQTEGDTEVLLHALIEWGEAVLPRLQGMFAFAFWDGEALLLARDHLGVKPLYICWDGGRLLFASEIKALLEHPAVSREVDPNAIGLYLECQYIPAPYTIFRDIRKLPPAHSLRLEKGQLVQKCYWRPTYLPKFPFDEETALEQLEFHLRRSVKSMLVSDVPIGAFVSGGVDSSLIAALMQAECSQKLKIFSIGVDHVHGEQKYAAQVADRVGAEFHVLMVQSSDLISALDQMFDEPFGDQAALPTLLLSKFTREQVKVVLTGEGADEVFAGYSNYAKKMREAPLAARFGRFPLPQLYPLMPAKLRKSRLMKAMARPLSRRHTTIPNLYDTEMHGSLLTRDFKAAQKIGLEHLAEPHYFGCDSSDYLDRMLHIDQNLWLADDLLAKVDRATMTHSLEARVPYLDHQLVEFAARLPTHYKLSGNEGKYLLKRLAVTKFLPPEIVYRPKRGFVMPLQEWMAHDLKPLMNDVLSPGGLLGRNILRPHFKEENATRLFALLALELWFRRYAPNYQF
ncbi:MAG TPA: asparagine synthase (glutamine-hydrolyzing) [Chlamydiales bacterium]|nr:asparagine synthase (glutamine-hydrolyzing) [Chlamydiales bacterium]